MPTYSVHFPEDWEHLDRFKLRLEKHYRGKASPYLFDLVNHDLHGMSIGTPESAFSLEKIQTWQRSEKTLIDAAVLANRASNSHDPTTREKAQRELAEMIIAAAFRPRPNEEDMPYAAESTADYRTPLRVSSKNVKLGSKPAARTG